MSLESEERRPAPGDPGSERALLGAVLAEPQHFEALARRLAPEDFQVRQHGVVWRALGSLRDKRIPLDLVTLRHELSVVGKSGQTVLERLGGPQFLLGLVEDAGDPANLDAYRQVVREGAARRRLIEAGRLTIEQAQQTETPLPEVLAATQRALGEASLGALESDDVGLSEAVQEMFDSLDRQRDARVVWSGYGALDELVGGFLPGQLVIVGARPSVGKSAFACGVSYTHGVRKQRPVGVITLEMTRAQYVERLVQIESGISMHAYRHTKQRPDEWEEKVTRAAGIVSNGKLAFMRHPTADLSLILSTAQEWRQRRGIELLVVDYIGLMSDIQKARDNNKVQELSRITRALKLLAVELELPVLALSQLSRASEGRSDPRPKLTDLRDSGSVEQDADIVVLLHRDTTAVPALGTQDAEMLVAKHRDGPTGDLTVRWEPALARYRG